MINVTDGETTHGQPYREVSLYGFDDAYIAVTIRYYPKSVYVAYEDLGNVCGYSEMDIDDVVPSQVVLFKKYPRARFNEQSALEELYRHVYPSSLDIPKPLLAKIAADIMKMLQS